VSELGCSKIHKTLRKLLLKIHVHAMAAMRGPLSTQENSFAQAKVKEAVILTIL
jgi:hypothetical protein